MPIDKDSVRARLLARRTNLLIRYRDELEGADLLLEAREPDWEDLAVGQRDAALAGRLSDADAAVLAAIVVALRRLEAGSYGLCERCGEPIAEGRLAVLPEASLCAECATDAESVAPT